MSDSVSKFAQSLRSIDTVSLALRTVRTAEGERRYGEPIGAVIETDDQEPTDSGDSGGQGDSDKTAGEDRKSSPAVQQETAQKLVDSLVSRGAKATQAKDAVKAVQSEDLAQSFLARLDALSDLKSRQVTIPNAETDGSVASNVGALEKAQEEYRLVRWRGQDIQVPKGARVGQVPGHGKFPAVFYWFDAATSEVHGKLATGDIIPPIELPAGRSLKSFFSEYVKSGGSGFPLKQKKKLGKSSRAATLQGEASNAF